MVLQIGDQFRGVGGPVSVRLSVVVGGLDIVGQGRELSHSPHVVVATPGRLADLLQNSPDFTLKRLLLLLSLLFFCYCCTIFLPKLSSSVSL